MKMKFRWFLGPFVVFAFLFLAGRIANVISFASQQSLAFGERLLWDSFVVGLCSDLWCAFLLANVIWWSRLLLNWVPKQPRETFLTLIVVALTVLGAAHVSYFNFFQHSISVHHLSYLLDFQFLSSNMISMFEWPTLFTIMIVGMGSYVSWKYSHSNTVRSLSFKKVWLIYLGIFATSLTAHWYNIRYRVQHNVPNGLWWNMVESLYIDATTHKTLPKLAAKDLLGVAQILGNSTEDPISTFRQPSQDIFTKKIKERIQKLQTSGEKVFLTTVLMESARHYEFNPHNTHHMTPEFSKLAENGVYFKKAYSVSRVTRSAQEAVWCGYIGSENASLMRHRTFVSYNCLPSALSHQPEQKFRTEFHWLHGGSPLFDSQGLFWKNQNLKTFLSEDDFSKATPRTDWGVSDLALFSRTVDLFKKASENTVHVSMILTMTNHIPWTLPKDHEEISAHFRNRQDAHDSFKTSSYMDAAIGRFVKDLKDAGVWKNHLLILIGDHGIIAPVIANSEQVSAEEKLSHVPFLLSGGLVESLSRETRRLIKEDLTEQHVSQAAVSRLLADLLDVQDFPVFARGPFQTRLSNLPVPVDLGDKIYIANKKSLFFKKDIAQWSVEELKTKEKSLYIARGMYDMAESIGAPRSLGH